MTGRAAAVRNRLLVAVVAGLLAWLFGWTSDEGLLMLLVGSVALLAALLQAWCGGFAVLGHWLFRYRHVAVGLRQLGDIIGEHSDDMHRAGLVVPRGMRRGSLLAWWRPNRAARPLPDLVPRLRHRPYDGGIVLSLEAVRAGMSQDDLLRAVPKLRSAWGVDLVRAEAMPGGRIVQFTLPMTDEARRAIELEDDASREAERRGGAARERRATVVGTSAPPATRERVEPVRPPDARTVSVVQGGRSGGDGTASRSRPPSIQPQLTPDERGRYELEMLPADAARTFSPRPMDEPAGDPNPSTAEIPVIEAPRGSITREPARPPSAPPMRRLPETRPPTEIDERGLRLGPHWRVGKER